MLGIANDEIKDKPDITDIINCDICGGTHRIEYGEEILKDGTRKKSKFLGFYKCGDKTYLASIKGKDVRIRK